MEKIRRKHDAVYKQFFGYPEMVRSLLEDFVLPESADLLDFSTLERCPAGYVTEDLREFFDDMVWKVKWRGAIANSTCTLFWSSRAARTNGCPCVSPIT